MIVVPVKEGENIEKAAGNGGKLLHLRAYDFE